MDTFPNALLGYRVWKAKDGWLHPLFAQVECWQPGANSSNCRHFDHSPPQSACSCGFHTYHHLHRAGIEAAEVWSVAWAQLDPDFADYDFLVLGAVAAKGRVEVHEHGFRAAEAQVLGLYCPEEVQLTAVSAEQLQSLSSRYRVPVFYSPAALEEYSQRLAKPVNAELLPHSADASLKLSTVLAALILLSAPLAALAGLSLAVFAGSWLWLLLTILASVSLLMTVILCRRTERKRTKDGSLEQVGV